MSKATINESKFIVGIDFHNATGFATGVEYDVCGIASLELFDSREDAQSEIHDLPDPDCWFIRKVTKSEDNHWLCENGVDWSLVAFEQSEVPAAKFSFC